MRALLWLCFVLLVVITLGDCASKALRPIGHGGEHQKLKRPDARRADMQ